VYYTIVRSERYARYSVVPVTEVVAAAPSPVKPADALPQPANVILASGALEVHDFSRATVVAAFAATTLWNNNFGTSDNTVIRTSRSRAEHIIVGLDYYLCNRDTYPGARNKLLAEFGIFGGVSVNALNNYFAGLAFEPHLGVNITAGVHFGRETALQAPFVSGGSIAADSTPRTYQRQTKGYFISAGLDLQIFRKVFGAVTGVGAPPPPAAGAAQ
jgi:hypothetical protein